MVNNLKSLSCNLKRLAFTY
ncbi:uncharacterized protein FFMR_03702 [Fusarium fujikuroi]|nr:uncharacterized protein FFMR_03702 [Fusarium fujikuroi]